MSFLPQRKKSPEEIARLRESLGIPVETEAAVNPEQEQWEATNGQRFAPPSEPRLTRPSPSYPQPYQPPGQMEHSAYPSQMPHPAYGVAETSPYYPPQPPPLRLDPEEPVELLLPTHHAATVVHESAATMDSYVARLPVKNHHHGAYTLHEHSDYTPVAHEEILVPIPEQEAAHLDPPLSHQKWVHSLRKSEQGIIEPRQATPAPNSWLPTQRHNDQDIMEIRRRELVAAQASALPPPPGSASLFLIIPGYVFALAGGSYVFSQFSYSWKFPLWATASCAAMAMLIAAFIYRRPYSRAHAAFIAAITFLVLIFAVLHFFPTLL